MIYSWFTMIVLSFHHDVLRFAVNVDASPGHLGMVRPQRVGDLIGPQARRLAGRKELHHFAAAEEDQQPMAGKLYGNFMEYGNIMINLYSITIFRGGAGFRNHPQYGGEMWLIFPFVT